MNRLVLVAAGGLAREVLAAERAAGRFDQILLVDDDPALWGCTVSGRTVVGGVDLVPELDGHQVLVCAGRGSSRRRIVERLLEIGVNRDRFTSSVHPAVHVPDGCAVGVGSILLAGSVLTADVRVGDHVVVMPNVTLTHDDVLEDYATVCAGVSLGGAVRVGSEAYLGMNAAVRENHTIGAGATLGMGAVLLRDQPAGETWVGVPARPVRRLVVEMGESA
jgi:sugar O-acyltransferase (sialic acid O-acetyltransferase NeuD family)